MSSFLRDVRDNILVYDGSKGTMLQKAGLSGGECPELWNAEHDDKVVEIYRSYKEAGSDVIQTNTFQGNRPRLQEYSLGDRTYELNYKGAKLAKDVMGEDGYVAASIGSLGKLMEPSGDLTFEFAYEAFSEQVKAVADGGADIVNFETFTDIAELRAALIAARNACSLPIICSLAFEANGRTLMGNDPKTAVVVLKSLGADMVGVNCSLGPGHMRGIVVQLNQAGGGYLSVKPNAGLPVITDGKTSYAETPEQFAEHALFFAENGARLIGGCCGTTPEHIAAVKAALKGYVPLPAEVRTGYVIASASVILDMDRISGIRIAKLRAGEDEGLDRELAEKDLDAIVENIQDICSDGYDALYINTDGVDPAMLPPLVDRTQGFCKLPFILESRSGNALEDALRLYRGKAGVVVDRHENDLQRLVQAAQKYGSAVLGSKMIDSVR